MVIPAYPRAAFVCTNRFGFKGFVHKKRTKALLKWPPVVRWSLSANKNQTTNDRTRKWQIDRLVNRHKRARLLIGLANIRHFPVSKSNFP